MTVKELIRKLKIFGKNKFVVVGRKDVVGIDWNDDGDVELFLEGIEELEKSEPKKPGYVSYCFGELHIPNTGLGRLMCRKFIEQQKQRTTTWEEFLSQRCSDLRHSSASRNNLSSGLSSSPNRSK